MNNNTTDLSAGGIFSYSYSSATRTVEFKVKEGLNHKLKIPTDAELKNYVNNTWNTTQSNYNSSNPLSINYLLSNYISTSPLTTWTSSYLNLVHLGQFISTVLNLLTTIYQHHQTIHHLSYARCWFQNNWVASSMIHQPLYQRITYQ